MLASQLISDFRGMVGWRYFWGAAAKGVVDCSGAFTYAFKLHGQYIYHGSNTIWRKYTTQKGKIGDLELVPGMAVFRWKKEGEPAKYARDGEENFYHIGLYIGNGQVIEAKGVLYGVIISSVAGWTHCARLTGVEYTLQDTPVVVLRKMQVFGGRLALRASAGRMYTRLKWMPTGATVEVLLQPTPDGWFAVRYGGLTGYSMAKWLREAA